MGSHTLNYLGYVAQNNSNTNPFASPLRSPMRSLLSRSPRSGCSANRGLGSTLRSYSRHTWSGGDFEV